MWSLFVKMKTRKWWTGTKKKKYNVSWCQPSSVCDEGGFFIYYNINCEEINKNINQLENKNKGSLAWVNEECVSRTKEFD